MATNETQTDKTKREEILKILTPHLWKTPPNYKGEDFTGYAIIAKITPNSSVINKANFESIAETANLSLEEHWFSHYSKQEVKMLLVPTSANISDLEDSLTYFNQFQKGEILDKTKYTEVEEQELFLLWSNLTPAERKEIALLAGKSVSDAEDEQQQQYPDLNHANTYLILRDKL